MKRTRQGPSLETWTEYSKMSHDDVLSIHCPFWPNSALEWNERPRHFGWPRSHDISTIIKFGCHLVPVGHPHSEMKSTEWRISFSIAERTLVWSFNHVQMQCYAVMKIILKEFIKVRCTPQNQVLCSYFIKTFLFWIYETNYQNFWHADNFRECIMYLLGEFSQCIREGVLRHYFIPRFNLLSVKLTREAQTELLQLFDIIIQSDISILRDCRTLQNIWSEFLREKNSNVLHDRKKRNMLKNDENMITYINIIDFYIQAEVSHYKAISALVSVPFKTYLKTHLLKRCLFRIHLESLITHGSGNKDVYKLHKTVQTDAFSFDIASCKIWYAILFLMKRNYSASLSITNEIQSRIPPFMISLSGIITKSICEAEQFFAKMFIDSGITVIQRAKKAWISTLFLKKEMAYMVPLAIQIELYFSSPLVRVFLSPFTCIYYLQFLCYHQTCQYDRRNHALQQLISLSLKNNHHTGVPHHTLNITGHCLLMAGKRVQALNMFYFSYKVSQMVPPHCKYNSALWYLQNFF